MMSPTSPESCEAFSPACEAFSKSAEIYDLIHAGKNYDGEAKRVLELLGPPRNLTEPTGVDFKFNLLDWGCGTGEFTRRLVGWRRRGADISPEMLRIAERKGVDVCRVSMATPGVAGEGSWPAQTCLFAAFSYASASHPPLLILENFRKAAAPGGRLVFDFVNADAEIRESQRRDTMISGKRIHVHQSKRLVDSRQIEIKVNYRISETMKGRDEIQLWTELHYLRTFTAREMAELVTRAGWKLEKFIDLESLPAAGAQFSMIPRPAPYYLTAVCSVA